MPTWTMTKTVSIAYGNEYESEKKGFFSSIHDGTHFLWTTPYQTLEQLLSKAISQLNIEGFRVVAVTPHTTSVGSFNAVYWKGQGGYGYGLGFSHITGMTIFASKDEEISEEEFTRRKVKAQLAGLHDTLPQLESAVAQLREIVDANSRVDTSITEKKRMIGGLRYIFNGVDYATNEDALEKQQALLAEFADRKQKLDYAEAALKIAQNEKSSLLKQLD